MTVIKRYARELLLALLVCAAATVAQDKPKIALYIASDGLKPNEKSFLTQKFLAPFTASGMYSVIDRSDIFTQKATQERIKQRDGSVNEKEIYKIGYEAGAKYICMVQLENAFGRWNIAARLVDVVTAEVYLAQGETDIDGELNKADFSGAAKAIFGQIHAGRIGQTQTQPQTQPKIQQPQTPTITSPTSPTIARPTPPTPPAPSIQSTPSTANATNTLTDSRDGKTYKTVVIGGKKWMAENLNYYTSSGSWCGESNSSNCNKYGRLYNWKTAKTVCPSGWHLPSRQEWDDLLDASGGNKAGKNLKSEDGWNNGGNGTDRYGFSALPGGNRTSDGNFSNVGSYGYWWTATERSSDTAYGRDMHYYGGIVSENNNDKGDAFSVRCVADN